MRTLRTAPAAPSPTRGLSWTMQPTGRWPAFAALLFLVACGAPPPPVAMRPDLPARLGVETQVLRHTVHFATDAADPDAEERAALVAFLAALPRGARIEVVAFGGADPRAGHTYNADLAARRARSVAAIVRHVLPTAEPEIRSTGESVGGDMLPGAYARLRRVEVVARVYRARAVPCEAGAAAETLGCTLYADLAAMIADPAELARPPELSRPDTEVSVRPVVRLRAGGDTSQQHGTAAPAGDVPAPHGAANGSEGP